MKMAYGVDLKVYIYFSSHYPPLRRGEGPGVRTDLKEASATQRVSTELANVGSRPWVITVHGVQMPTVEVKTDQAVRISS